MGSVHKQFYISKLLTLHISISSCIRNAIGHVSYETVKCVIGVLKLCEHLNLWESKLNWSEIDLNVKG